MHRWFTAHLPFEILNYFPGIDTDNHYNGIGLHGVFDSNYERVILTKIDYIPLSEKIRYENDKFVINEKGFDKEVFLNDSDYFCNVSWTISFNFNTKSWISFHSYIPNWYVGESNFFYSGLNSCPNDFDALVAVVDQTIPSTTTTTTIPLTTTTSTTIVVTPPDCDFDATAEVPDCDIEGEGVFVDPETVEPCERPRRVQEVFLFTGYTLVSPSVTINSTGSLTDACAHVNVFAAFQNDETGNYTPTTILGETLAIQIGNTVYDGNTGTDCQVVPDGWYFTGESAGLNQVFEIISGEIVNISSCGLSVSTTTTTTTPNPGIISVCYESNINAGDISYPLGGIINYIDVDGNPQVYTNFYAPDTIQLEVLSVTSTFGVTALICPVITTTTTTLPPGGLLDFSDLDNSGLINTIIT